MAYLTEPLEHLYVCGEAFSDYQGWVEGALRSANLVLAKGFHLKPINVLYQEEHHIGPSEAMKKSYARNAALMIRKYIDPGFSATQEKELLAAQGNRKAQSAYGISLRYFDKP
jgi:hypothetical protein